MSRIKEGLIQKIAGVDQVIHTPARLVIIKALSELDDLDCVELARLTELSWGNLATHLNRLEASGYIQQIKGYLGKKPNTKVRLTELGMQAYTDWARTILAALPSRMNPELLFSSVEKLNEQKAETVTEPKLPPQPAMPKIFWFLPADHRWDSSMPPIDNLNQQYS